MKGKTVLISGGSQGIGFAIAKRLSLAGANVVIASKEEPIETLPNSLYVQVDVRDEKQLQKAVAGAKIDILVNNTSVACLADVDAMTAEQYDLVMSTSVRAAFFLTQACLPSVKQVINISPSLNLDPKWFENHLAFSIGKMGMSLLTLGLAAKFPEIQVNSLWPQATIATQTLKDLFDPKVYAGSRWPSIMGDAAYELLQRECTGQFFTDEELLNGRDLSTYLVDPKIPLRQALFVSLNRDQPITKDLYKE